MFCLPGTEQVTVLRAPVLVSAAAHTPGVLEARCIMVELHRELYVVAPQGGLSFLMAAVHALAIQ